MKTLILINIILYITSFKFSECQTTTSFRTTTVGAVVAESYATVPPSAQKIYTTSVELLKQYAEVEFVESTFINAAKGFYGQVFVGYLRTQVVGAVDSSQVSVPVTYDVFYKYTTLNYSSGASDEAIVSSIGNVDVVANGLEADPTFNALFTVNRDPDTFAYEGSEICPVARCPQGQYLWCAENTTGVSVWCVSPCTQGYCHGDGVCTQPVAYVSPVCECNTSEDSVTYVGARCQFTVLTIALIVTGSISFVLLVLLIIYLYYRRRADRRERERKEREIEEYNNRAFAFENADKVSAAAATVSRHEDASVNDQSKSSESVASTSSEEVSSTEESESSSESEYETTSFESNEESSDAESTLPPPETCEFYPIGNAPAVWLPAKSPYSKPPKRKKRNKTVKIVEDSQSPKLATKKTGIEGRAGWIPSLGPNMFELKKSIDNLNTAHQDTSTSSYNGETDL